MLIIVLLLFYALSSMVDIETSLASEVEVDRCISQQFPSQELINEILGVPGPFSDEEEENDCKRMVEALSGEEVEQAARTSYSYWVTTVVFNECPSDEVKIRMAMREARRHYVGHGKNFDSALKNFNNTLHWRKEQKIDLLRAVCIKDTDILSKFTEEEIDNIQKFRRWIEQDLNKQIIAVRGHDRSNRSIAIKFPRAVPTTENDSDSFRTTQLFIAEKAIAITEIRTRGREETQLSVFDFANFNRANSPPFGVAVNVFQLVQAHYPERGSKMIIVYAPFWMQLLKSVLDPFLSEANKGKLLLISREEDKKQILEPLIDAEQAMPFMLPGGKLTSAVNAHKALHQPFHLLYDE